MSDMLKRATDAVDAAHVNCAGYMNEDSRAAMARAVLRAALDLKDNAMVRRVAFAFNPMPFNAHASLYQYCLDKGDDAETAQQYADDTHQPDIDRVIAQTRMALIALRADIAKEDRTCG